MSKDLDFIANIPIDTPEDIHEAQLDADIMADVIDLAPQDVSTKESIFEQYGLGNACQARFLHHVSLATGSRVFRDAEFEKNSQVNADILWGKTPFAIKKRDGLYSLLKSQSTPQADFLFIFHRKDFEKIYASAFGERLDYGGEEINRLKAYFKDFARGSNIGRELHAVFTDQNALWGTDAVLEQGNYYIVSGSNFYIPDSENTRIAQLTIKGKVAKKVNGLKNIFGKQEKYLYHSEGKEVVEEVYPIYTTEVDFTFDRCLFDNLTVLDMPQNRKVAIIAEGLGDDLLWKIQSLSYPCEDDGILQLDEQGEWFLIQEDCTNGFDFFLCKGGKEEEHRVLEGKFRRLNERRSPKKSINKASIPKREYRDPGTRTGIPRTPAQGPRDFQMTVLNIGRQPKSSIVQEFSLTHRLIPFLVNPPDTKLQEYEIPVGEPSTFLIDDTSAWMYIRVGFKNIYGETLSEDRLKVIPRHGKKLYLLGESTPIEPLEFEFTDELMTRIVQIVDKPGLTDIAEAGFRCTLDFKNVPKDPQTGNRYHWCRVSVDPSKSYPINMPTALIGRGCFRPAAMNLIAEGFWDTLQEKRYRASAEEQKAVDRMIERYGYMDIMSSRYHGLFVKDSETLYNISLSVPIYVLENEDQHKCCLNPMPKDELPDQLKQQYSQLSQLEKDQFNNRSNREQLKKLSASFLTSENGFLRSESLFKVRDKTQLVSGDSVIIGLSQYLYQKTGPDQLA
jgi:hypothetical protein